MRGLKFSNVRLSHLLRHCAVGSIVRTSQFCVTVKDISYWTHKDGRPFGQEILYVEQIKKSLGLTQKLRRPPVGKIDNEGEFEHGSGNYIPAQVFPSWFVCTKCRQLQQNSHKKDSDGQLDGFDKFGKVYDKPSLFCHELHCHGELEQVYLVQVDNRGYLYDVPWYRIAHQHSKQKCDWHANKLYWHARANGRYKENTVICTCGALNTFSFGEPRYFQGHEQPWLYDACFKVDDGQPDTAQDSHQDALKQQPTAYIMEVNDTRVYTPITKEALVIPPESRIARGTLVDRLYCHEMKDELLRDDIDFDEQRALKNRLKGEFDCDATSLEEAIKSLREGYPNFDGEFQQKPLHELEYEALTTHKDFDDEEDFVTHHVSDEFHHTLQGMNQDEFIRLDRLIDKVVAVSKLKEILVFKGFTRGGDLSSDEIQISVKKSTNSIESDNHSPSTAHQKDKNDRIIPPDVMGVSDWLPALELYGEGIFISFDERIIRQWQQDERIQKRADVFAKRLLGSIHAYTLNQKEMVVNARFLFLHAFSHLFIKELENLAGYPAASLKEKIYSSSNPDNPMAGVLIYTAVADVDGTLGGLVELSEPKSMIQILTRVFERVWWCSLDPVCGSHGGQGPALLNMAACHCCLLLPETSCMCGNVLLDRVMIKGDECTPSIFDFIK